MPDSSRPPVAPRTLGSDTKSGRSAKSAAAAAAEGEVEDDPTELYDLVGPLGEGSFGLVWKAKHLPTDQMVAVKVIY